MQARASSKGNSPVKGVSKSPDRIINESMSSDSSDSEKEEFLKNLEEAKSDITDSSLMTDSQLSMSEFKMSGINSSTNQIDNDMSIN